MRGLRVDTVAPSTLTLRGGVRTKGTVADSATPLISLTHRVVHSLTPMVTHLGTTQAATFRLSGNSVTLTTTSQAAVLSSAV